MWDGCKRTRGATNVSRLLRYAQGMRGVERVMVRGHSFSCQGCRWRWSGGALGGDVGGG